MRKTFVSLGLAASVHILPAAANSAGPAIMPQANGGSFTATHGSFPTVTHASPFALQHSSTSPNSASSAHAGLGSSGGFVGFPTHLSNFNQTQNVANHTLSQVGPHTWAAGQAVQLIFNTTNVSIGGSPINLDLSSTQAALSAGGFLKSTDASVSIDVGGKTMMVTAKSQLTPAEYLAAMAVAAGQPQSLVLDSRGSAVGGSVVVSQRLGQTISSLVIPQGVTVTDFSRNGSVKVTGDVSDSGNFYLAGGGSGPVTINAKDVTVASSGVLTDTFAGSGASTGLVINASGMVSNAGAIASGANLSINSGAGSIVNSGSVSSSNGSITLSAPRTTDLNINAAGGSFSALSGDINIRETNYTGAAAISMSGGDYFSNNLNVNAGAGTVNGAVGQVSGSLNTTAAVAHLAADTAVLQLGKQTISGDPTYANTGDIQITGPITVTGANLAIVAGGNVTSTSSNASITDAGGDVLIIAGGVVSGGSTSGASIAGAPPAGAATGNVTVALSGGTGGSIDLSSNTSTTVINTSNASGNGGNVTLVALANGATGGVVNFANVLGINSIDTRAINSGASGNVNIIGGASTGNAISTGNIATGGMSDGGSVSLAAASASTNDGKTLTLDAGGSVISFNHIIAGASTTGQVNFANINTSPSGTSGGNAGNVSVSGGAIIGANGVSANGGTNLTGPGGNGGSVSISAQTSVNVLSVSATGGSGLNNVAQNGADSPPLAPQSNGGAVIISANGNVIIGSIQTSGGDGGNNTTQGGGDGGQGGLISVTSFGGNIGLLGSFNSQGGQGSQMASGAPSGGSGGAIIVSADAGIDGTAGGNFVSDGGRTGSGNYNPNFNNISKSGSAGEILLLSNGRIETNPSGTISAQAGTTGDPASTMGRSGNINLVATDDISTGNINVNGNAGSVTAISLIGGIQIGNGSTTTQSITATNGGVVTLVSSTGVNLTSVDSNNTVMTTGSAFISTGANSTISFSGGDIKTAGNNASGEAWVLQYSGTINGYTVNGAKNQNEFTTGAGPGGIGEDDLIFSYGTAPTNYVAGPTNIISQDINSMYISTDNPNMLVPLVTPGTVSYAGFLSSTSPVGFYGQQIQLSPTSTDSPLYLQSVIATAPSNQTPVRITINLQSDASLGTVAAPGQINITTSAGLLSNGPVVGTGVAITAPSFVQNNSNSFVLAAGGNVIVTTTAANSNVGGNFYTGATGSVTLVNTAVNGVLSVSDVNAITNNLTLQGSNITIGIYPPVGSNDPVVVNTISNGAAGGNITLQDLNGNLSVDLTANFVTDGGGDVSFIANSTAQSTLNIISHQANIAGGGDIILSSPQITLAGQIAGTDKSNILIDSGSSTPSLPLSIIADAAASLSTNGGAIVIRPTGDLTFSQGGGNRLNLNAAGSNGDGLVNVQGLGNVTLNDGFILSTDSPIQFNVNSDKTVTLAGSSEILQNFSGNGTFPDPLGGTFSYSILFQNLITNFNIAGTGSIIQAGAIPGNTVFNDFIDVGFADNTNLTFTNNNTDPSGNSGFINFFTRQIQVNGTVNDHTPLANIFVGGPIGVNFNTNLPSPGPGNLAFGPGDLATSASLQIHGFEQVNIGFAGSPGKSLPSLQEPLGNLNFGLGGAFNLFVDNALAVNVAGTVTIFSGSTLQNDSGLLSINTTAGSNGAIVLGGTIATDMGSISVHADGLAGIIGAGGIISTVDIANNNPVLLSSDSGNIGSANSPIMLAFNDVTANTGGNGSVYLSSTANLAVAGTNTAGSTGVFSVTAPVVDVAASSSITAGSVTFTTPALTIDGAITAVNPNGTGLSASNATGALTVAGAGTITAPTSINFKADGNLTLSISNTVLDSTNYLDLTATGGVLTLSGNTLAVSQYSSGNGGTITLTAAKIVTGTPGLLTLDADGATGGTGNGGAVNLTLTNTTPLVIGGASGDVTVSANAGTLGGNGGFINIQNGGNLTVDASKVSATASGNSRGGAIELEAGTTTQAGNLVVNGDLHVDGAGIGNGGSIALISNSKSPLIVGTGKVTNGTSGAITANGTTNGVVQIGNYGTGGVTVSRALTAFSQIGLLAINQVSGSITINAALGNAQTQLIALQSASAGKISDSSKAPLTSASIYAFSNGGTISLANIQAVSAGTQIYAQTTSKSAVAITNLNANPLNISSVEGGALTIKAPGIINVSGSAAGTAVTVETTAKTGGSITVDGNIASTGNITIKTPGDISISGQTTSAKNTAITASGATSQITIAGTVQTTSKGTVVVSLPTSTVAGGFDASSGTISGGGAVTLTATKTDMLLNNVSSGATVKVTAATGIVQNTGTIDGLTGVTLTTTTSANGAGGITLDTVQTGTPATAGSSGGAIVVTAAGGVLTLLDDGQITAFSDKGTKAAVTLENKLITGATPGSIVIGAGSLITTSGKEGSNIDIVMGAVPASPKSIPLPTLPGVTFSPNSTPPIYLGLNGVNFNTSGGANPIAVNVIGTGPKVVFNTGALPASTITINGSVNGTPTLIQADPPAVSNSQNGSGAHTLFMSAAPAATPRVDNTAESISISAPPAGISATATPATVNTTIDNSTIAAVSTSRTLYGAATAIGGLEADNAPIYSVRPVASGEIDATIITGQDVGVSSARPGLTDAVFGSGAGISHTLRRGAILVAPDKDTSVDTAFGQVNVAAGAIALVVSSAHGTAVYNLDDTKPGSVMLKVGAESVVLAPGRHVTVTSHQVADFHAANLAPGFAYRNLSARALSASNLQAFSGEFSLPHAFARVKQLRELVNSSNPRAKKLAGHMIKTTAIMSQMGQRAGSGQYDLYVPAMPAQMAMAIN